VNWDWGGSLEDMKMKIFFHFNQIALWVDWCFIRKAIRKGSLFCECSRTCSKWASHRSRLEQAMLTRSLAIVASFFNFIQLPFPALTCRNKNSQQVQSHLPFPFLLCHTGPDRVILVVSTFSLTLSLSPHLSIHLALYSPNNSPFSSHKSLFTWKSIAPHYLFF
jgi:hypothetical protein